MTCIYLTKLCFLILMAIFTFSNLHRIILSLWEDTKIKKNINQMQQFTYSLYVDSTFS